MTDDDPFPEAEPAARGPVATPYLANTLRFLCDLVDAEDDPLSVPEVRLAPLDRVPTLRLALRQGLLARAEEETARLLLAQARGPRAEEFRAAARAAFARAVEAYGEALERADGKDRVLSRRASRCSVEWNRWLAADALADADAARSAGDEGEAEARESKAIRLLDDAYEKGAKEREPLHASVAALFAEALLRRARCAEAGRLLDEGRRRFPADRAISAWARVLAARSRGRSLDGVDLPPEVRAVAARLPPCPVDPLAAVESPLAQVRVALLRGDPAAVRVLAEPLLAASDAGRVDSKALAAALRDTDAARDAETLAARDALVRALDPFDDALAARLASSDDAVALPALRHASRYGFAPLGVAAAVEASFARAASAARRLAFCDAAVLDGSRSSLVLLSDLLVDLDDPVRAAAWRGLSSRLPSPVPPELAFDPTSSEPVRSAARDRIRAWLASRPDPKAPPKSPGG